MRMLRVATAVCLVLATAACGSDDDASPATDDVPPATEVVDDTDPPATEPPITEPPITDPPATEPPATEPPATEPPVTDPPATDPPATEPPVTDAPSVVDVKVYLLRGEQLAIAHRDVEGPAVLSASVSALLAGPTEAERNAGMHTEIPADTGLLGVNLVDGVATVDLTGAYESGGGSMSMNARIAQVVFTATQFDNVDSVLFHLDGAPIDFLGGEGIVLDEPQTRSSTERAFTGGVIIDTPAPGAEVNNPFTVTGEADVFEGDFPIEVWRDGEQIGPTIVVRAGAWGDWADFETTITLDAGNGLIELIAYDDSGCGPPECPEPIRTVVPLTFVAVP